MSVSQEKMTKYAAGKAGKKMKHAAEKLNLPTKTNAVKQICEKLDIWVEGSNFAPGRTEEMYANKQIKKTKKYGKILLTAAAFIITRFVRRVAEKNRRILAEIIEWSERTHLILSNARQINQKN